uniref:Uncharacterized protein n=1 Tax=Noctiluca scintillans TaxID=2966 RepID=A0A7S1ADW0_NOCSC|mmetsp:Transcript_41853/g.110867  ORF Transcript_41853/g.110867 Transcript_41853/m.110867 type:complete len:238 (+) Transcript_41853:35-748(+)
MVGAVQTESSHHPPPGRPRPPSKSKTKRILTSDVRSYGTLEELLGMETPQAVSTFLQHEFRSDQTKSERPESHFEKQGLRVGRLARDSAAPAGFTEPRARCIVKPSASAVGSSKKVARHDDGTQKDGNARLPAMPRVMPASEGYRRRFSVGPRCSARAVHRWGDPPVQEKPGRADEQARLARLAKIVNAPDEFEGCSLGRGLDEIFDEKARREYLAWKATVVLSAEELRMEVERFTF